MKSFRFFGGALVACLLVLPALAEDTLESAEKQIVGQNDKIKAMSAKLTIKSDMEMGGMKISSSGDGVIEFTRSGDKMKSRTEMKMSVQQGEQKSEMNSVVVSDGEFTYSLQDYMGMKQCVKQKADEAASQITAKGVFDQLRKQEFTLKLLPDQAVDGKPAWTIEGTPKEGSMMAMQFARITINFSKDNGLFLRQTSFTKDGKEAQTITISDIKLDPTFPPDRFEFKAPEGVMVQDMTATAPPTPAPAGDTSKEPKK